MEWEKNVGYVFAIQSVFSQTWSSVIFRNVFAILQDFCESLKDFCNSSGHRVSPSGIFDMTARELRDETRRRDV